jgi:hypothetical protein
MHRKRVEELVGDENALERFGQQAAGARQPIVHIAECRQLRIARRRARFYQVQANVRIQLGMAIANRPEDVC